MRSYARISLLLSTQHKGLYTNTKVYLIVNIAEMPTLGQSLGHCTYTQTDIYVSNYGIAKIMS